MSTTPSRNITSTPMAPYMGLMRSMSLKDKRTVVDFLMDDMKEHNDKEMFESSLKEWQRDTRFLSSSSAVTSHPAFRRIVNMGGNAVPFIIEEIAHKPSNLVWALNAIFHKKTGSGKTVTDACKLWIEELKKF